MKLVCCPDCSHGIRRITFFDGVETVQKAKRCIICKGLGRISKVRLARKVFRNARKAKS